MVPNVFISNHKFLLIPNNDYHNDSYKTILLSILCIGVLKNIIDDPPILRIAAIYYSRRNEYNIKLQIVMSKPKPRLRLW